MKYFFFKAKQKLEIILHKVPVWLMKIVFQGSRIKRKYIFQVKIDIDKHTAVLL